MLDCITKSYFGKFMLTGHKAKEAVQWLCGADVTLGDIGRVTYTPLCNVKGGVEADLTVTKLAEDQYYFAAGGNTAVTSKGNRSTCSPAMSSGNSK